MEGHSLITFNGKIWVPAEMQMHLISWYHNNLQHAGITQLLNTIGMHFGYPGSRRTLKNLYNSVTHVNYIKSRGRNTMVKYLSPQPYRTKHHGKWYILIVWALGSFNTKTKLQENYKTRNSPFSQFLMHALDGSNFLWCKTRRQNTPLTFLTSTGFADIHNLNELSTTMETNSLASNSKNSSKAMATYHNPQQSKTHRQTPSSSAST